MTKPISNHIIKDILKYPNMILKLHVLIDNNIINDFNINNISYSKFTYYSYLTIEIIEKDDPYNNSKRININALNIYQIIQGFKKIINNIYDKNNKIFYIDKKTKTTKLYKEYIEKNTYLIDNIGKGYISITPIIIFIDDDSYEGVRLYINKLDNFIDLTIDRFETLIYVLDKIDIETYGSRLLQMYFQTLLISENNFIDKKNNIQKENIYNKNIFTNTSKTNTVQGSLIKDENLMNM